MPDPSVVEGIFLQALEKGAADERAAFLDSACGGVVELRQEVEQLLAAHPKAVGFLEPAAEKTAAYEAPGEQVGSIVAGRYKLLEQIGEGGMGTVWVAEQTQPVRRKVALKLIKAGMDSKAVIARFEAERQALALMDHPNIAKVLDGGVTENGRPFFVMEYVKGIPITTYCDSVRLSIADRLALFVPVCQAVQHAHQKGVIHRDLKPSNLLVCLYDGRPVTKVIDFGLAKAIHQPLTEHTLHTAHGVMMGTPLYMSPEQAEFNNLDVDTRTDIYALGVILYELLTGTTPLEKQRFQQAACDEMLRLIKEEDPPRPSVRLSGSEALPTLAAQRQMEPVKLGRLLRGELDWMVMKALDKDRNRRYETANAFAVDVQRYLAGEAVQAVPPSTAYRLRKFARKNRTLLSTAAAFAALLIIAATVSGWLAIKARRAEAWAEDKRIEAEANANIAEASRNEAFHNAGLAQGALMRAEVLRRKAEMSAASLQVDVDLSELQSDARVGLLRMARTLQGIPSSQPPETVPGSLYDDAEVTVTGLTDARRALREFVTFAALATGQEYAPLLPPITHDGDKPCVTLLNSKGDRILTRGGKSARLWDALTGRQIAVLRVADEKVVEAGLSPDGATAFTHSLDGVVRLWETKDGAFRAATEARPGRLKLEIHGSFDPYEETELSNSLRVTQCSNDRLMTSRIEGEIWKTPEITGVAPCHHTGPVELWDATTGRFVARLDAPGRDVGHFRFLNDGRWVTTTDRDTQPSVVLVFSAEDGRLLTHLAHPDGEFVIDVWVSPDWRRIATVSDSSSGTQFIHRDTLRVWNTQTWQTEALSTFADLSVGRPCWMEEEPGSSGAVFVCWSDYGWFLYRVGRNEPIANFPGATSSPVFLGHAGNLVHSGNGWVYDTRTWQRLVPPPGRKFHPDLAKFAADGRFVHAAIQGETAVIDTQTEKILPMRPYWTHLPEFGMILLETSSDLSPLRLLPSTSRLDIPSDLLELWARVAVRGELAEDGTFKKWDEATWENHRQELASKPPPISDFPFPGYVATDKLHWLRAEFRAASEDDKSRLAKQLLGRAEAGGDKAEATWWQRWLQSSSKSESTADGGLDQ